MARSVNKVMILGNLGKDPESRFMDNGTHLCRFSVATSRSYKQNEEWKEQTEWHNIVMWGKEKLSTYMKKGSKVYVEGRLQTRSWENKDTGAKQYATEIVAEEVVLLDGKPGSSSPEPAPEPSEEYAPDGVDVPF